MLNKYYHYYFYFLYKTCDTIVLRHLFLFGCFASFLFSVKHFVALFRKALYKERLLL